MSLLKPLPENPHTPTEVPEGLPRPGMALILGSPGQGKTSICAQLLRAYLDAGVHTRVYLISPTFHTNRHVWEHAGVRPEDAFIGVHQGVQALEEILRRIKAEHATFQRSEQHWAAWEKHQKGEALTPHERSLLEMLGRPLVHLPMPRPAIVLDDVQATKVCSSRVFQSVAVRRRHLVHDPPSPTGLIILSQSLKSGALPRAMRSMCDLVICFPTRDPSVLKDIFSELASRCTWEQFQRVFNHATSGEGRPYLVVDMTRGFNPAKTFRRTLEGAWLDPEGDFL